ncbi:MAG: hypothetical protein M0Z95_19615 [Actinomycetota bacterium]|nr:hypothetical protein [Actinomycetota bacterium]
MRAHLSVQAPAVTLQGTDDVSHLHEFKVRDRCDDLLEPSRSLRYRRSRITRRGSDSPAKSLVVGSAPPTSQNANLEPLVEAPAISLAARYAKVRREGYAK